MAVYISQAFERVLFSPPEVKVLVAQLSDSLPSRGLWPDRLPCPWNSPGENLGVGNNSLLHGIFLILAWNPSLPHCRQILDCVSHQGSPVSCVCVRCCRVRQHMDCSPPGSSVHEVLQGRILVCVAIPSSLSLKIFKLLLQDMTTRRQHFPGNQSLSGRGGLKLENRMKCARSSTPKLVSCDFFF